jgi:hypothetical protein
MKGGLRMEYVGENIPRKRASPQIQLSGQINTIVTASKTILTATKVY